jgi:ubiquinone biosynthesis protein Coq4
METLTTLKEKTYEARIPLPAEVMDLVSHPAGELGNQAEMASFRPVQIHPDIYMNELLQGMRTIHQVLPAIMKKLGSTDFQLDRSELSLPVNALGYVGSRPVAAEDQEPEDEQMPPEDEPKRLQ